MMMVDPDLVIVSPTPGLVVWRYPRRYSKDLKRSVRTYVVTHEPSGFALVGRARITKQAALGDCVALGDLKWRGKPFDWTQPTDAIKANKRAQLASLSIGGFIVLGEKLDEEFVAWGARNGVKVTI